MIRRTRSYACEAVPVLLEKQFFFYSSELFTNSSTVPDSF